MKREKRSIRWAASANPCSSAFSTRNRVPNPHPAHRGTIGGGKIVLPGGREESEAVWRVIADPFDGTRSLMDQKRSAWILTGVASNRGKETSLADIELAVQTELPVVKQHLCDALWATRGGGAQSERFHRISPPSSVPSFEAEEPLPGIQFPYSFLPWRSGRLGRNRS